MNVVQLLLTLTASTASYVLIERPVRTSRITSRSFAFGGAVVAMAVTVGASSWLLRPAGGEYGDLAEAAAADFSVQACPDNLPCVKYEPPDPDAPTVITVGDSTMQMYDPALVLLAEQYGFRYVQVAVGGCPIGDRLIATGTDGERHKPSNFTCHDAIPGIYESAIAQWPPDLVLATSSNEGAQHVTEGELVERDTPRHAAEVRSALGSALDVLSSQGGLVAFLAVLPGGPSVDCLATSAPNTDTCVRPAPTPAYNAEVNQVFADLAAERSDVAGVIDFTSLICPDGECPLMIDDVVVRYDGGHFTGTWSRRMAPRLDEQLRALGIDLSAL